MIGRGLLKQLTGRLALIDLVDPAMIKLPVVENEIPNLNRECRRLPCASTRR
jgi:hypothetical protein